MLLCDHFSTKVIDDKANVNTIDRFSMTVEYVNKLLTTMKIKLKFNNS